MLSDLRQSKEWARFLASQGWEVEEVGGAKAYIRKLPVYGSVIKIQRPPVIPPVEAIDAIARKHRALFTKLEPLVISHKPLAGFEPDPNPNLPTKTIVIDLTKSEKDLWQDLSQDARQSIKKATSYQLLAASYWHRDKEFEERLLEFHQLLRETGRRQNFWTPSFAQLKAKVEVFNKSALLFLAYYPKQPNNQTTKQPVAGALTLIHDGVSYGHLAASSDTGRKLHAPYLLMWEMMRSHKRFAKNGGPIKLFNLEGIYDPRYHRLTRSWQGLTLFKQKFGGEEVEYPLPLIKYYNPVLKLLFKYF